MFEDDAGFAEGRFAATFRKAAEEGLRLDAVAPQPKPEPARTVFPPENQDESVLIHSSFGAANAPGAKSQIRLDDEDAVTRLRAHLASREPTAAVQARERHMRRLEREVAAERKMRHELQSKVAHERRQNREVRAQLGSQSAAWAQAVRELGAEKS